MGRLATALARWDIQAHRTLAAQPDTADLVRVARTQALIATAAIVVIAAAAEQGMADSGVVQRLVPTLERSQVAWSLTANLWTDVPSATGRADAALIRAASDVRTAIAATACTPTGWATPAQLADRLDLNKIVATLQLGTAASVDIAYVMREVAAVGAGTLVSVGPEPTRPSTDPRGGAGRGPSMPGVGNKPAPVWPEADPHASQRGLVALTSDVIAYAGGAVAVGASLEQDQYGALRPPLERSRADGSPPREATCMRAALEGPRR